VTIIVIPFPPQQLPTIGGTYQCPGWPSSSHSFHLCSSILQLCTVHYPNPSMRPPTLTIQYENINKDNNRRHHTQTTTTPTLQPQPPNSFQPLQHNPAVQLPTAAASCFSSTFPPRAEIPSPTGSVNMPTHAMATLPFIKLGHVPLVKMETSYLICKTFKMRLLRG